MTFPPCGVPARVVEPIVSQILETMYFRASAYRGADRLQGHLLGASMAFSGPVKGEFRVIAALNLVTALAADFLGLDEAEVAPPQIHATIRELTNVACGATIAAWMPRADFHFAIPREITAPALAGTYGHCFSTTSGQPELAIEIVIVSSTHEPRAELSGHQSREA